MLFSLKAGQCPRCQYINASSEYAAKGMKKVPLSKSRGYVSHSENRVQREGWGFHRPLSLCFLGVPELGCVRIGAFRCLCPQSSRRPRKSPSAATTLPACSPGLWVLFLGVIERSRRTCLQISLSKR